MRMVTKLIMHAVFGNLTGVRIELTDVALKDGREPDISLFVSDQAMRTGIGRLERVLAELSGVWVQPPKFIGHLLGNPERAIRTDCRVMRARFGSWNIVFLDGYF